MQPDFIQTYTYRRIAGELQQKALSAPELIQSSDTHMVELIN